MPSETGDGLQVNVGDSPANKYGSTFCVRVWARSSWGLGGSRHIPSVSVYTELKDKKESEVKKD